MVIAGAGFDDDSGRSDDVTATAAPPPITIAAIGTAIHARFAVDFATVAAEEVPPCTTSAATHAAVNAWVGRVARRVVSTEASADLSRSRARCTRCRAAVS